MFDRITLAAPRAETQYVTRTVHEHRAPTDDSVKLLREMESKAKAQVIKAIAVEDNSFNCVVHVQQDAGSDRILARAIFELNGRKMTVEESISGLDRTDKEKLVLKLRDAMAVKIATECLVPALRTLKL